MAIILQVLHVLVIVAFLKLSRGLKKLMQLWIEVDRAMNKVYGYPKGLDCRFMVFTIGYLIVSTGGAKTQQYVLNF